MFKHTPLYTEKCPKTHSPTQKHVEKRAVSKMFKNTQFYTETCSKTHRLKMFLCRKGAKEATKSIADYEYIGLPEGGILHPSSIRFGLCRYVALPSATPQSLSFTVAECGFDPTQQFYAQWYLHKGKKT